MEEKYAILIVDDNVDLAGSLRDVLETEGYDVTIGRNGQDALAICRQKNFDLAFIDIKLPDASGTELIKELAGLSPDMEYIVITGHASLDSAIAAAKRKNVVSYETKPLNIDHLLFIIRQVFERKQTDEKLRREKEKFQLLVEKSPLGVSLIGKSGVYQYVNPRFTELSGYALEDISNGREWFGKVHPDKEYRDQIVSDWITFLKGSKNGRSWPRTFTVTCKDGSKKTIRVLAVMMETGEQFVNYEDITERKRVEKKLKKSFEKLRRTLEETVKALASAAERRDPYTAGHQRSVTALASAIAKEMGISGDRIEGIQVAGILHDLGKISIPAEILSKPDRITDNEFSIIKEHAQTGYDILKAIEFPWPVAEIVFQHHERIDGSGYPKGLKGEEILVEARIIAVADVVEAMASHRPYRAALGINKALEEISQNKGMLYDSEIVDACLNLFAEKGFKFESTAKTS